MQALISFIEVRLICVASIAWAAKFGQDTSLRYRRIPLYFREELFL